MILWDTVNNKQVGAVSGHLPPVGSIVNYDERHSRRQKKPTTWIVLGYEYFSIWDDILKELDTSVRVLVRKTQDA